MSVLPLFLLPCRSRTCMQHVRRKEIQNETDVTEGTLGCNVGSAYSEKEGWYCAFRDGKGEPTVIWN